METLIILIAAAVLLPLGLVIGSTTNRTPRGKTQGPSPARQMRCPNCGSPVIDHGTYWECGYCGDSGSK